MSDQDWKPVILNPKPKKSGNQPTVKDTHKYGTPNKQGVKQDNLSKVAQEEEAQHVKLVGTELGRKIQSARVSQGLTQKQLAAKMFISVQIVQEYESGKAVYNGQYISKFKRVLGSLD